MAINPARVLVIYDTSSGTSETKADYYASARGLKTGGLYHKIGCNFSGGPFSSTTARALTVVASQSPFTVPTSNKYVGLSLSTAIWQCVSDNNIEAIFAESELPKNLTDFDNAPLECCFNVSVNSTYTIDGTISTDILYPVVSASVVSGWKAGALTTSRPIGRIGYPGCALSDIQRIVTDALWAESFDNRGKLAIVGGLEYLGTGDKAHNKAANENFAFAGVRGLANFDAVSDAGEYGPSYSWANFRNGNAAPIVAPFGLLYGGNGSLDPQTAGDYTLGGLVNQTYKPPRGAWAFAWQSSSFLLGYLCLKAGGCAAICDEAEPFATNVPSLSGVAMGLLSGLSFAETVYLCHVQSNRYSVYGDPLYAPYVQSGTISGRAYQFGGYMTQSWQPTNISASNSTITNPKLVFKTNSAAPVTNIQSSLATGATQTDIHLTFDDVPGAALDIVGGGLSFSATVDSGVPPGFAIIDSAGNGLNFYGTSTIYGSWIPGGSADHSAIASNSTKGIDFGTTAKLSFQITNNGNFAVNQGYADLSKQKVVPTAGQTKTVPDNCSTYIMKPTGTLATLTVNMPAVPFDGQVLTISSTQIVTALTMSGNGKTLLGGLTTIAANGFATWIYDSADTTWYRSA